MNRNNVKGGRRQYRNVGRRKKMEPSTCNSENSGLSVTEKHISSDDFSSNYSVENKTFDVAEGSGNIHCSERNIGAHGKDNMVTSEETFQNSLDGSLKPINVAHNLPHDQPFRNVDTTSETSAGNKPNKFCSVNQGSGTYTGSRLIESPGLFTHNNDPFFLVSRFISEITRMTDPYLADHFKEIGKISLQIEKASGKKIILDILENRKSNMASQLSCFNKFIEEIQNELTKLYEETDHTVVLKIGEDILARVKAECNLFGKMLPAYFLKQIFKSSLNNSQVIVISCDVNYSGNIVIPLLLQDMFGSGLIASCEVNEAAALISAQNCSSVVDQKLGKLVGYDVGQESIISRSTKILFTTIQELFAYSLRDPLFSRYSFIVLNGILHRSIETDILLVSLYKCLCKRDDLRLVVIVATEHDVKSLNRYFSKNVRNSVINTGKLMFPVQVIWKEAFCRPDDDDVINEAVNICFAIHVQKLNEKGDVLAFLPTEQDALKAAELTVKKLSEHSFNDVHCVHINFKSSVNKLHHFLEQQQQSLRTIIFVSSGFEFVMFSNIRFVVDSGRISNICYDTEKKLELQKMSFISRSRSQMRKKCLGRYASGVCYRMYSRENYKKSMVFRELPEVLNRSPLNSIVKVFQYGFSSSLTTEFVEPFTPQVEKDALTALEDLCAWKDGKLTQLGEHVNKLPFLPEYAKLIFLGRERGFPFEAIVFVSFFLVEGYVFKYENTEEFKKKTDAAKLYFIQNDSDTLTFLNIYRQWVENECSESWCINNCIDFSFLDRVRAKIKEVHEIVSKNLGKVIPDKFSSNYQLNSDMSYSLQEVIFECFRNNVCVYTGHFSSGYRCLTAECIVFVHPSACLTRKENLPQFIVYDKCISKTRNLIIRITAIPDKCVMEAFDHGLLKVGHDILFEHRLVPLVIDPVGLTIIKYALTKEKLRDLEEQMKKETKSEMIVIEPSEEKGNVTLYALPGSKDKAEEIIRKYLDENLEKFWDEKETVVLELQKGGSIVPVDVTWSKGGEILLVATGSRGNSNTVCHTNALCSDSISHTEKTTTHRCILLKWLRRPCVGDGFVEFENREDFSKARIKLAMKTLVVKDCCAEVKVDEKAKNRLRVLGLGPEIADDDLKKAVQRKLAGVSISDVKVTCAPPFETTCDGIEAIGESFRKQLQNIFGRPEVEVIEVHQPENDLQTTMTAEIRPFISQNLYSLEELAFFLDGVLEVNNVCAHARTSYYCHLFCGFEIWNKLQPCVFSAHMAFEQEIEKKHQSCDIEETILDSKTVRIKISSEEETTMTYFRKIVQDLLEGYIITSADNDCLPKLFCHGGNMWLRALEKSANVLIVDDYKSKTVRLYGSLEACKVAMLRIAEFLNSAEEEIVYTFVLDRGKNSRPQLRAIIQKYDVELKEFIDNCELRSAELDIRKCELTLHGSADSIEKALKLLEELESQSESDCVEKMEFDQETCPICLYHAHTLTWTFRLEHCGHLYCGQCIRRLVATSDLPLVCSSADCEKELILEDIRKALDHDTEKIKDFLRKSLEYFITHHKNFVYCPAPDCSMFVDIENLEDEKWNCPLCHNDVCLKCQVIYHHGFTCDIYQKTKTNPDYSYELWKKTNANCKECPQCNTGIQKTEGCNHMTCSNCGAHFCWRCRNVYPNGTEVYNHLPKCKAPV